MDDYQTELHRDALEFTYDFFDDEEGDVSYKLERAQEKLDMARSDVTHYGEEVEKLQKRLDSINRVRALIESQVEALKG